MTTKTPQVVQEDANNAQESTLDSGTKGGVQENPWDKAQWTGLVYGNPGTRKTFFAATLPKPMKVFLFDPPAKGLAYHLQGFDGGVSHMDDGGMFRLIWTDHKKEELVVEIEYFFDKDPTQIAYQKSPCAYERFQTALIGHMDDSWKGFRSVVLDSYTFCEMAAVRLMQYKLNPAPGGVQDSKHNQMQWSGQARGTIQTDIMAVFPWASIHACVLAHVDDQRYDEQEKQMWGVAAIGKLGKQLPGAFSEVYRMYIDKEGHSKLMTESDGQYIAQTHLGALNPCEPTWEALWRKK